MILFRQKYPRWWFDWNVNLLAFANRVGAYCLLLTDVYPATDEEHRSISRCPTRREERAGSLDAARQVAAGDTASGSV